MCPTEKDIVNPKFSLSQKTNYFLLPTNEYGYSDYSILGSEWVETSLAGSGWYIYSAYIIEPSFILGQILARMFDIRITAILVKVHIPLKWLLTNSTQTPWMPAQKKKKFPPNSLSIWSPGSFVPPRHWHLLDWRCPGLTGCSGSANNNFSSLREL